MTTIAEATNSTAGSAPAAAQDSPSMALIKTYWPQLKRLLPSHIRAEAWYSAAFAALYRGSDPSKGLDLRRAADRNPESLMFALFDAARQGLEPGTPQYYLTPRNNRNAPSGVEVLGIRGYQGEIELIYRAGAASNVIVEVVRRNDRYRYKRGMDRVPVHDFDPWAPHADRGELVGVYAYCDMKDGSISRVVELNTDDIARAMESSPGKGKVGPWVNDVVAMWLKTGVHRLQKFVPTSAEYITAHTTVTAHAQATGAAAGQAAQLEHRPAPAIATAPGMIVHSPSDPPAIAGDGPPEPPLDPSQFAQPPAPEDDVAAMAAAAAEEGAGLAHEAPSAPASSGGPAKDPQHRAIMRLLGKPALSDEHRHAVFSAVLGRTIRSGKDLQVSDASHLIDRLQAWKDASELPARLAAFAPVAADPEPEPAAPAAGEGELPERGSQAWHDAEHPVRNEGSGEVETAKGDESCPVCAGATDEGDGQLPLGSGGGK